jgi:aryl-alcohol dehydrogenase-like predicted oxidoreductase
MENQRTYKPTYSIGGDMMVNRMGFGAMRITGDGVWGEPADRTEALRVLQKAIELGINFIDTADAYGPNVSEELIAEALHPYTKDLVIGTKGGLMRSGPNAWQINAHPDHLRQALEGSLKRLKLERIDLYQLHRIDPEVPFEKSLEFLQKAQQDGLIRHIGLSEVTVKQIKKAQEFVKVVSVQNMYSVDNRKWESELQYTRENGIAFIPWYPLGGGNKDVLAKIEAIAQRKNVSAHQLALSWLLHHSENILLIPGTSKVKHLEENYKATEISLSTEELKELNEIAENVVVS